MTVAAAAPTLARLLLASRIELAACAGAVGGVNDSIGAAPGNSVPAGGLAAD